MSRVLILTFIFASALTSSGSPSPHHEWTSPDGRWLVACACNGTGPDSCTIVLSRRSDQKVFFTHHTNDRYIKAVWSSDSTRCVLLDAPDNANSFLWVFHVRRRDISTEKLDYDKISDRIEAAVAAARRREPSITRSGIEKIEWPSSAELRLHIIYNNVPVLVVFTVTKPHSPAIRVLPDGT
jgi:hypothetical protein